MAVYNPAAFFSELKGLAISYFYPSYFWMKKIIELFAQIQYSPRSAHRADRGRPIPFSIGDHFPLLCRFVDVIVSRLSVSPYLL